jgi:hypothetical protein
MSYLSDFSKDDNLKQVEEMVSYIKERLPKLGQLISDCSYQIDLAQAKEAQPEALNSFKED